MNKKTFQGLQIIAIVALFFSLGSMPYFYYQLLRWGITSIALYSAFIVVHQREDKKTKDTDNGWTLIFIIIAIFYNPLVPISLDRSMWAVIDIVTAIIIWVSISKLGYKLVQPARE